MILVLSDLPGCDVSKTKGCFSAKKIETTRGVGVGRVQSHFGVRRPGHKK